MMLGMYSDNAKTMQKTINLACELDADICNFAISAPYPGTEWGHIAETSGWLKDSRWEAYDQNYSAQVSQPNCTLELVQEYQKRAYYQWYLSHRGIKFLANSFRPEYFDYFVRTICDHLR